MRSNSVSRAPQAALALLAPRSLIQSLLCLLVIALATDAKLYAQVNGGAKKPSADTGKDKVAPTKSASKQEAPQAPVATWPVKERGRNEEEAEKGAVESARKQVTTYLTRQNPPFLWTPSLKYVKENLLAANPRRLEDEDVWIENQLEKVKMQCWEWTVRVTREQMEKMRGEDTRWRAELAQKERQVRAEQRMIVLGKFTGWAVLALAGLCLYLRLDQYTEGCRRGWLRLALVSLVATSGIGWWLL